MIEPEMAAITRYTIPAPKKYNDIEQGSKIAVFKKSKEAKVNNNTCP